MSRNTLIGAGLLLLGALVVGLWGLLRDKPEIAEMVGVPMRDLTVVRGYFGSEKAGFLANRQVVAAMASRCRLSVDARKAGSIELAVSLPLDGMDFLWPSSRVAADLALTRVRPVAVENTFSSPIVFYSWKRVADALEKAGIVSKREDAYYIVDMPRLMEMIRTEKRWSDLGLDLYGKVAVRSTDPTQSNSGALAFGLYANMLNGGEVVATKEQAARVLPMVAEIRDRLGRLEHSTGVLFDSALRQGEGAFPLFVGYENSIIELLAELNDPKSPTALTYANVIDEVRAQIHGNLRILYPEPTTISDHVLVALTDGGKRLADCLRDPELQKLAWTGHGFRIGLASAARVEDFAPLPLTRTVNRVIAMPEAEFFMAMLDRLKR